MNKLEKLRQISSATPTPEETQAMYLGQGEAHATNTDNNTFLVPGLSMEFEQTEEIKTQHIESTDNIETLTNQGDTPVEGELDFEKKEGKKSTNKAQKVKSTINKNRPIDAEINTTKDTAFLTTFRVQAKCATYIAYMAKMNGVTRQQFFDSFFRTKMLEEKSNPSEISFESLIGVKRNTRESKQPMGMSVTTEIWNFIKSEADKNLLSYSAYVDREIEKAINDMHK